MNKNLKYVIIFLSGAAAGAGGMYLGLKNYFQLKADLEIESVKEAYNRHMDEVEGVKSSVDGGIEGPEEINDIVPGVSSTKSSIVKKLNNKPPMTDYTKMFKERGEETLKLREAIRDPKEIIEEEDEVEDPAEAEHPEEDEPYDEEEDMVESDNLEAYQLNVEHQKAMEEGREPYVIELSDFELTCAHYRKETLHYYVSDDILTTDEDEVLNPYDCVGNCIEKSGFSGDENDLLYVRNDILMVDYEIEKVYSTFDN